MSWKRVFLFYLLFSILVLSFFLYIVMNAPYRPRRDTVPPDAYVVPWMRPNRSFDSLARSDFWEIDLVMSEALKLSVTFEIETDNETRVVPSTVYLGHDSDSLYVGGRFEGMYENPTTNATLTLTNFFNVYFDVSSQEGTLTHPESGCHFWVAVNPGASGRTKLIWGYEDLLWAWSNHVQRFVWLTATDYYSPRAQEVTTVRNFDALYDNSTGTVILLFSRFLWRPGTSDINALQMRTGECWVMKFLFELGFDIWDWAELFGDFVDGWPQKTYPYLSNDSSWWPKLAIDLSNPPEGFLS